MKKIRKEKTGKTAFQKNVEANLKEVSNNGNLVLQVTKVFCHEITTPLAIDDMRKRGLNFVFDPNRIKMMIDHVSPAKDSDTALQGKKLREFCREHHIEFLDVGKDDGICHAVIPEKAWVFPGGVYPMGDSHTGTHGVMCSLAFGVGTTELEIALLTGNVVLRQQKVIRVNFVGKLPENVFAKDLILELIKRITVKGATNAILEFGGHVIDSMSMEARMTITNMAVEAGATSGIMNVDQRTIDYLWPALEKSYMNKAQALSDLQQFNSDLDAEYDQVIEIDVSNMVPVTTINYSVGDVVPVSEIAGKKMDQVFIGSCTNGRFEDLQIAASVIRQLGGKVDPNTRVIVIPATKHIYMRALEAGLIKIFLEAGCVVINTCCGPCLGMSGGIITEGEECLSTSNRNFYGRMGKGGMVHLASPATAAFTAVYGVIAAPIREICHRARQEYIKGNTGEEVKLSNWEDVEFVSPDYTGFTETIEAGQGTNFSGAVYYLPNKNIDTDMIIPATYLSLSEKKAFGAHCLENVVVTPEERIKFNQSRILVAGENFGSGSSREQAVYALEQAGIRCVIAPNFARIFETNMFAYGLPCIALPLEKIEQLFQEKPIAIEVDWDNGLLKFGENRIEFELSEDRKEQIRNGGSLGIMLKQAARFQKEDILSKN